MNTTLIKSRLLTATLATGVGVVVLLSGQKTAWIPALDTASVRAAMGASDPTDYIYEQDTKTQVITTRKLTAQAGQGRPFQLIQVTDDPNRIFEHTPPSPLDYAVILESLRNRGYQRVILATRMTWDDQPGLEVAGLSGRLALFEHAVIALPVTRGATAQPLPVPLQRALVPFSQVEGSHALIPMVNQTPLPAHADGGEHTLAGFSQIESSPGKKGQFQMLAQWQEKGVILSLELLSMMAAHDVRPAELMIHPGRHILLGKDGPVIPIDHYGQTSNPVEPIPFPKLSGSKAEELITQKASPAPPSQQTIGFIHATGRNTSVTNLLPTDRLQALIHLSANARIAGKATHFQRLPLWVEIVFIVALGLVACWFLRLTRWNRHLALLLTAALSFLLLAALMDVNQHWFALSAPLATLAAAWLVPVGQSPRNPTMQEVRPPSSPQKNSDCA